jgi:hypothetical protein
VFDGIFVVVVVSVLLGNGVKFGVVLVGDGFVLLVLVGVLVVVVIVALLVECMLLNVVLLVMRLWVEKRWVRKYFNLNIITGRDFFNLTVLK